MLAVINSFVVSVTACVVAFTLGWSVALTMGGSGASGRKWWAVFSAVALAMPPFVVANCWLEVSQSLRGAGTFPGSSAMGLGLTSLVLGLMLWPVFAGLAVVSWQSIPSALIEAEPRLRGWRFQRDLLWPATRPAMTQAGVIVLVLALTNFAVPVLFQVRVLPEIVWIRFNANYDSVGTLFAAWPMMLVGLLAWIAMRKREVIWPRFEGGGSPELFRARTTGALGLASHVMAFAAVAVSIGMPFVQLAANGRTWTELHGAVSAGWPAILNSLLSATVAASLLTMTGLWWSGAFGGRSRKPGVLWAGFLVPGVVLSMGWIFLLNRPGLRWFQAGFGVVILALLVRYAAPAWSALGSALRSADGDLVDAARLGGGRWAVFRTGYWPQIRGPVAAIWYVIYLLTLWDVESVILLMPPGGETLAMRIFNLLHYGHAAQVNALCVVILAVAAMPLALMAAVGKASATRR